MKPEVPKIDPNVIKAEAKRVVLPKAAFSDVMVGASAMGPATAELVGQWSGGSNMAGAVLNAAFSGIDVAGGMGARAGMYSSYGDTPGIFGASRYTTQYPAYTSGYKFGDSTSAAGTSVSGGYGTTAGTDVDPAWLMQTMNQNNLQLLELQAMMQSNMQSWTTKSNILSADHRARMSMVEKFTARG